MTTPDASAGDGLRGCRVFVVEDSSLLSMLVEKLLIELGCTVVGRAARLDDALRKSETLVFDVVLLDVNLHGMNTFSMAETMLARGQPFVLATGYSVAALPESLRVSPLVQKPYRKQDIEEALRRVLGAA